MQPYATLTFAMTLAASVGLSAEPESAVVRSCEIGVCTAAERIKANRNGVSEVRQELLSSEVLGKIGAVCGLSREELAGIVITGTSSTNAVVLQQVRASDKAFWLVKRYLDWYVIERAEGHTAGYFFAALTNSLHPAVVQDPDLKELLTAEPSLPPALMRKWQTGSYTNLAGTEAGRAWISTNANQPVTEYTNYFQTNEIVRWVRYFLVDGEIAWAYHMSLSPLGRAQIVTCSRHDAKDFDPRYIRRINQAEQQATDELAAGRPEARLPRGELSRLKKEKLRSMGIDWRSGIELNPGGPALGPHAQHVY
jgi:hypothetical protein